MLQLGGQLGACTGYEYGLHVAMDGVEHALVGLFLAQAAFFGGDKLVVLGRHNDGIDAHRAVVLVVFDSDLALGIGAEISHVYTLAADFGKGHHQRMTQRERQGDIERCLVGGVAEHHTLVAGALLESLVALNATVDVGALLVHGKQHAARVAVEAQLAAVVADFVDYAPRRFLHVDICITLDFAGNNHLAGSNEGLAGYFRLGIAGKELVEDGIADLVGNLVGMPL